MSSITRKTLTDHILDVYQVGRRGIASAGSVSSITDDGRFGGPGAADEIEVGCQVFVTYDAGGVSAAPENEFSQLSSRPKLTSGVFNLDPPLRGGGAAADQYQILYGGLRFVGAGGLHDAINKALRDFPFERRVVPITLVPDGDMLASATGDWTAGGAASLSKASAGFPLGLPYLGIGGAGAGEYAQSANVEVEEGASYYLEVLAAKAGAGNGTLSLRDIINGTAIALGETDVSQREPMLLVNPGVAMSSTTERVAVRLAKADGSGNSLAWYHCILRKNDQRFFALADRPQRVLRIGQVRISSDRVWHRRSWEEMIEIGAKAVQADAGLWQLHLEDDISGYAAFYEEFIQPGTLTTSAGTTAVPLEPLAAIAAEMFLRPYRRDKRWADRYAVAAEDALRWRQEYLQELRSERKNVVIVSAPRL